MILIYKIFRYKINFATFLLDKGYQEFIAIQAMHKTFIRTIIIYFLRNYTAAFYKSLLSNIFLLNNLKFMNIKT